MAYEFRKRLLQIDEDDPTYGAEWGTPVSQHIGLESFGAAMMRVARGRHGAGWVRSTFNVPDTGPERADFDLLVAEAQTNVDGLFNVANDIIAILTLWENDDYSGAGYDTPQEIMNELDIVGEPSNP